MKVSLKNIEHTYMKKTPFEKQALANVNVDFEKGSFTAIIGHTGSGKSTLVQHINGLLKPHSGHVTVGSLTVDAKSKRRQIKALREHTGMVFQYPEHQLFEETVEKDLLFGPRNAGKEEARTKKKLPELLELVGLDKSFLARSPFELSGGQMRRVAIAGVLAVEPKVLILDEPTAGLDPKGQEDILSLFKSWQEQYQTTTIMITHQMEEAARLADRIIVMSEGRITMEGAPSVIYEKQAELKALHLDVPEQVKVLKQIEKEMGVVFSSYHLKPEDAARELEAKLQEKKGDTDV